MLPFSMGQGLAGRREVKRAYWGLRSQAAEVGGAGPLEHMWTLVCTKLCWLWTQVCIIYGLLRVGKEEGD